MAEAHRPIHSPNRKVGLATANHFIERLTFSTGKAIKAIRLQVCLPWSSKSTPEYDSEIANTTAKHLGLGYSRPARLFRWWMTIFELLLPCRVIDSCRPDGTLKHRSFTYIFCSKVTRVHHASNWEKTCFKAKGSNRMQNM